MQQHLQLIVLSLCLFTSWVASCPSEMCVCKWKNGKQTAECMNRHLTELPGGLDVGTQVLNFSGNSVTYLKAEWFYHMNLINLQKVFLMRNEIARIHNRAFQGLSNLVELDLSDNLLTTVPSDSFPDYGSLMRLALNGNPIKVLRGSAFKHLPFLTTLELTNCQIEVVENEAFLGMDNLEWLRLDGNRITNIRGSHVLPDSLHGISLQGNRWTCDCSMVDLHRWLSTSTVPQTEEPKCVQPTRLAGSTIRSVDRGQLACLPEISPKSLNMEIAENRNLTLSCKVEAVPAATISWWFQGRALENHTIIGTNIHLLMTFTMEQGEAEKRIDLFISNTTADTNGTFVCTAENAAGRVQANYTVRVIGKEEPVVEQVKFPFEYYLIFIAGAAGMSIIVLVIVCILLLKCCCQRRRQRGRRGACNGNNGGNDGGGANGHWKKNPAGAYNYANGDGQSLNNGPGGGVGGLGGRSTTLITEKGMVGTGMIGADHQLNGGLGFGKQDVIMYVSNGLVADQRPPPDGELLQHHQQQSQQQIHPLSGVGGRVAGTGSGVASVTASPPHSARNYSPDPINPDLINDTEKQRMSTDGSLQNIYGNKGNNGNGQSSSSSSSNGANCDKGALRDLVATSYHNRTLQQKQSHLGTLPRTRLMSPLAAAPSSDHHHHHQQQHQSLLLQPHHHHQADVHLNPSCFLTPPQQQQQQQQQQGMDHPVEYNLTNHAMAMLPASRQLVAAQPNPGQSMNFAYRTLPHRMKIRNVTTSSGGGGPGGGNGVNGQTIRFARDAEFLTGPSLLSQPPHSFDMYTTAANVRYTADGYPYTAMPFLATIPGLTASAGSQSGATTIATTQQVQVAYQDAANLQFLPSPPEGYKVTDVTDSIPGGGPQQHQQWPVCLPGYHQQQQQPPTQNVPTSQIVPIKTNFGQRFASPLASPASSVTSSTSSSKLSTSTNATTQSGSGGTNNNNNNSNINLHHSNGSGSLHIIGTGNHAPTLQSPAGSQLPSHVPPPPVITKRCVGAQTTSSGCDDSPITTTASGREVGSRRIGGLLGNSSSTLKEVDETEEETSSSETNGASERDSQRGTCRHLNGPLADSPDEGYVGDSGQDGNGCGSNSE